MTAKKHPRGSRWSRLVTDISVDAAIDRLFRFIEMVVITALIGVAFRVVSEQASRWLVGGLAFMAGFYLGLPIARWVAAHILRTSKDSEMSAVMLISFGISAIAVVATSGLRILLSETFQIDRPRASVEYNLWEARLALRDCSSLGRTGNDATQCVRRWASEISKLEAQERGLNHH